MRSKDTEVCMVYFNSASGFWRPKEIHAHFRDIKGMGADSVMTNFNELARHHFLKSRIDTAHEEGLKMYLMPGRVAGLFAAGIQPSSMFVAHNWDALMQRDPGKAPFGETVACVNHPKFIDWFYPAMKAKIENSGADGIIFDEPKDAHDPCYCKYCCEKVDEVTPENMIRLREKSMAEMMGRVSTDVKSVNPGNKAGVQLMCNATPHFKEQLLAQDDLGYIGHDGPLCKQGREDRKDTFWEKNPYLLESMPEFMPQIQTAGKEAFILTETFDVQAWACPELAENLDRIVDWPVGMFAFNYYPHDNQDPELVMDVVREVVKKIDARR